MVNLKIWKHLYDKLGNDYLRSAALTAAGAVGVRKDLIRMDTNCCCNIRCIMCNSRSSSQTLPYMKFENFKKIMDQFGPTTRMLYLSCAFEPLITPDFSNYLKYAKLKGIPHISFCTNALLLDDAMIQTLIETKVDEIIISFNGFNKEDYNRIMKGADFEKVCANLKKLSDAKRKYHSDKPKIRMNTILMKSNLKNFGQMFHLVQDYDIDFVQFRELMLYKDQNDPKELRNELLEHQSPQEYLALVKAIRRITERLQTCGKEIILPTDFLNRLTPNYAMETAAEFLPTGASYGSQHNVSQSKQEPEVRKWSILKKQNKKKHRCSIPFFSYWIDYNGIVRVCGYDDRGIIGNAFTDSPKNLAKKKRAFQRQALCGKCEHHRCTINVDTSTIV